jgi:hypothetical protein
MIRVLNSPSHARDKFDLLIGCAGYETRSSYAVLADRPAAQDKISFIFEEHQVLSFSKNRRAYQELGFLGAVAQCEVVNTELSNWAQKQQPDERSLLLWVDITSMSRPMIAQICYSLHEQAATTARNIEVDFVYSLAKYSPPPPDYGPIVHKGAVIPELAGWVDDPNEPSSLVIGIGYEAGLALGIVEDLEPAEVWAFRPTAHDSRYDAEIDKVNCEFFEMIPQDHVLLYPVDAFFYQFRQLESLVYGVLSKGRAVIVPFGLKSFALCSVLLGIQNLPQVSVWRVSGGCNVDPVDRAPTGQICRLRVSFSR